MNSVIFRPFSALVTILLVGSALEAQQEKPRSPSPRSTAVDMRARDREMRDRSMALDRIGKDDKAVSEVVEKLKADFRRLQTIDYDMMREVAANPKLDYGKISEAVGEMNQCAGRLKANMAVLTMPDGEKELKVQDAKDDRELRQALEKLDAAVSGFVNSMAVVDAKNNTRAAINLNSVIQLSDSIKRSSKKLARKADKN